MNLRWINIPWGREAIRLETICLGHFSWLSKWRNVFVTKVLLQVIFSHVNWLIRNSPHMLVLKYNTLCREEFPKFLLIHENTMITVPVFKFLFVVLVPFHVSHTYQFLPSPVTCKFVSILSQSDIKSLCFPGQKMTIENRKSLAWLAQNICYSVCHSWCQLNILCRLSTGFFSCIMSNAKKVIGNE